MTNWNKFTFICNDSVKFLDSFVRTGSFVIYLSLLIHCYYQNHNIIKIFCLIQVGKERATWPGTNNVELNLRFGKLCFHKDSLYMLKASECHNWCSTIISDTIVNTSQILNLFNLSIIARTIYMYFCCGSHYSRPIIRLF